MKFYDFLEREFTVDMYGLALKDELKMEEKEEKNA
jgi:hypothetical protein